MSTSTIEQHVAAFKSNYAALVGVALDDVEFGEVSKHTHRRPPAIVWVPTDSNVVVPSGEELDGLQSEIEELLAFKEHAIEAWCYGDSREQADALHHNLLAVLAWSYPGGLEGRQVRLGQWRWMSEEEQVAALNLAGACIRQRVYVRTYVAGTIDHTTYVQSSPHTVLPAGVSHEAYYGTEDSHGDGCDHDGILVVPEHDGDHTDDFS